MNALESFRENDQLRAELHQLLTNEVMVRALFTVRDSCSNEDIADKSADAIASVRVLSRRAGWHGSLDALVSLTQPLAERAPQDEESSFGVPPEA